MRKGMLEYCVLLLLHREAAYASDIITQLKRADLIVVEGTLYPCSLISGKSPRKDLRVSITH